MVTFHTFYHGSSFSARNVFALKVNNWDDFGFRTTFEAYYFDEDGVERKIGTVNIMFAGQTDATSTSDRLQEPFESLDETFCSLGGQSYYEELMGLPEDVRTRILSGLQDCVFNQEVFERFRAEDGFRVSLLRSAVDDDVINRYPRILRGEAQLTAFNFSFSPNGIDQTLQFDVEPNSTPPTNIHVLIGSNGVGKSRILAGLSETLTPQSGDVQDSFPIEGTVGFTQDQPFTPFVPTDGKFRKVMVTAFSAFDQFPAKVDAVYEGVEYTYLGLKRTRFNNENEAKLLELDDLTESFARSCKVCLDGVRKVRWERALRTLSSDPLLKDLEQFLPLPSPECLAKVVEEFGKMSSGHRIVFYSITKMVEFVDEYTLLIIDEPENHLHPPLLASYMRAVSELMINRNGVAIVATHSPIVLQEVPKSCVTVLNRVGEAYSFHPLEIESFGENVGALTRSVFHLQVQNSGFYSMLSEECSSASFSEVYDKFDGQIGAEGLAQLQFLDRTKE